MSGGRLSIPDHPVVPFIVGDGIGPDVTPAAQLVLDAAVARAYRGTRSLEWLEVLAGERARAAAGEWLPRETLNAFREFRIGIKGPLATPVGGGIRSLNVAIRQKLDLYANVRPVHYIEGFPSPVRHPEKMRMVLFREATEDVYAGWEWQSGSPEAERLLGFLRDELHAPVSEIGATGVGIKAISERRTKRLVRQALQYALDHGLSSVTLVHKGNIMKFTEGAFRDWGYDVAAEEFADKTITEEVLWSDYGGVVPGKRIVVKDRIADNMLQQLLTRPEEYEVLALPNLNGDYLSDAAAGQVGGLGIAHGANIGDETAVFEAVHGSAPKYAGLDKANPTALILSGAMMLEHIGWHEASALIPAALAATIAEGRATYDLARQLGVQEVACSAFAEEVAQRL